MPSQWAALGKAFGLQERAGGARRIDADAGVVGAEWEVKKGEKQFGGVELAELFAEAGARSCVEHVDNVEEEERTGGGGGVLHVLFELGEGCVADEVEAAGDSDAELGGGDEVLGERGTKGGHNGGGGDAAECGADADGSEFVKVGGVFVEGNDIVGCEVGCSGGRDAVVGEVLQERGEGVLPVRV